MNRKEKRRLAESRELVNLSIVSHGGPWGDCERCGELEEHKLRLMHRTTRDWDSMMSQWYKHLAMG